MRSRGIVSAGLFALVAAGCGSTSQTTPAGVLVVDDASRVSGCRALGTVADNELDDLQKKAAKLGGNVGPDDPTADIEGRVLRPPGLHDRRRLSLRGDAYSVDQARPE